ncbi:hypothetical protein SAMN06297144_3445 [Sphingomonas guangdongensis]|uniref:Uncharacterized protein n=1 Tax=Sphingomonas guangdongensis TaxID=1141890 RepID=A0A285R340_9SPHN|nr:hypothetical protein [Sphingomonas guangdongensis]SOB88294.1 hypothetical protein SAMN06297144_3445 [Sphingomonas guangdongensis]
MTAMNAWRSDKAAYLMTDTAIVDTTTGKITAFTPKTTTVSARDWHAAIGVTGRLFPGDLQLELSKLQLHSFAELIAALPPILQAIEDGLPDEGRPPLGLVIASWTPDEGPAVRCLANVGEGVLFPNGYPAGRVCLIDYWLTGNADHPALMTAGKVENPDDGDAIAAEIIAAQRAEPFAEIGCHAVGGAAYVSRVGEIGIATWQVAEWPEDRVGERIAA